MTFDLKNSKNSNKIEVDKTFDKKSYSSQIISGDELGKALSEGKRSEEKFTMDDFWVMKGWYYHSGAEMRLMNGQWRYDTGAAREAVIFLVEKVLKIAPRDVTSSDFKNNRLATLLCSGIYHSVYEAIQDAFPDLKIKPWQMKSKAPVGTWKDKENRVGAIKELVIKLEKKPQDLLWSDIIDAGHDGLIREVGNNYNAVKEAFPELDIKPWQMLEVPVGTWKLRENRIGAIRELVTKLGKEVTDVTYDDFVNGGKDLSVTVLSEYYNHSPYMALKDAFPELNLNPENMHTVPNSTWDKRENRVRAIKSMVEKSGKEPITIDGQDFKEYGLLGLLSNRHRHGLSMSDLINEAYPKKNIKISNIEEKKLKRDVN